MKPRVPNPREQAVAWVLTFWADWEECRDDSSDAPGTAESQRGCRSGPHTISRTGSKSGSWPRSRSETRQSPKADSYYAPEKAWSLLAAWGAVWRFFPELPEALASTGAAIKQDAPDLLAALRQASDPAEWLERAQHLHRAWNFAVREDALRELEMGAIDLFDRLDRHSLALCMARRLASEREAADLTRRAEQLEKAETFFAQHVDAFLPAAHLASAVIAACRPDLEVADPELWRTLRKHRQLEEVWMEAGSASEPQNLPELDKKAIQDKVSQRLADVTEEVQPQQPPEE